MRFRSWMLTLPLAAILAACGSPAAAPPTTLPQATAIPATAIVAPTATPLAPTVEPTIPPVSLPEPILSPEPAGVLPAPFLFVNDTGQLTRIEADGATVTTLTSEAQQVNEFAIAPDGSIVYTTFLAEERISLLVRIAADGGNRVELARGVLVGVSAAADNSVQVGVYYSANLPDGTAMQPGIWSFPLNGAPELLVAAIEPVSTDTGLMQGTNYAPLTWSPDGRQLLLRESINFGPDGPGGDAGTVGLAVYNSNDRQTTELRPMGESPLCFDAAWSADGAAVYCANGATGFGDVPALWRLTLATGAQEPLIPGMEGDQIIMTISPRDLGDGVYVMVGAMTTGENGASLSFMPRRISYDGSEQEDLLPEALAAGYDGVLWAPDGSGMIMGKMPTGMTRPILWQPFDGSAPVELATGPSAPFKWE